MTQRRLVPEEPLALGQKLLQEVQEMGKDFRPDHLEPHLRVETQQYIYYKTQPNYCHLDLEGAAAS